MANGQYDYSDLTVEKTFKEFYSTLAFDSKA